MALCLRQRFLSRTPLFLVVFVNQPVDDIDDGDAVDIRITKIILCNQQFLIIISNVKEIVGFAG